jgi:preprotein translocase subunit SecD
MNILNNLKTIKNKNMKTLNLYLFVTLIAFISCKQNDNQTQDKASFEIYETIAQKEVPINLIEEFQQMNMQLNTDTHSPIIAFVPVDSTMQLSQIVNDKVKFLQTAQPVDKDKKYIAIVAVKNQSSLNTSDLKKTKPIQNNIEIYFNLQGASKWSDMTKSNIGKMIAFSINNKIYALTSVNGEIKNGTAIINGLENAELATKVSSSLNANL